MGCVGGRHGRQVPVGRVVQCAEVPVRCLRGTMGCLGVPVRCIGASYRVGVGVIVGCAGVSAVCGVPIGCVGICMGCRG